MTYDGVVKGGVIVLRSRRRLAEGTKVKVEPVTKPAPAELPLPGFGAWKHRKDLGPTGAVASLRLRRRVSSRGKRA